MMLGLTGRVANRVCGVAGCDSGEKYFAPTLIGARRVDRLEKLSKKIIADGGEVYFQKLDVTRREECDNFADLNNLSTCSGNLNTANKVDMAIACWEWKMGESKAGKFSGSKCKISSWVKIASSYPLSNASLLANNALA